MRPLVVAFCSIGIAPSLLAQSYDMGELQLRVSRDGLAARGSVNVVLLGDGDRELSRATVSYLRGIEPGNLGLAIVRLSSPVRREDVRTFRLQVAPSSGDTVRVAGFHLILGREFPRTVLLSERTIDWNGGERRFEVQAVSEASIRLSRVRFAGRMGDGARLDTTTQCFLSLADGRTIMAQPSFPTFPDNSEFSRDFLIDPPAPRGALKQLHLLPVDRRDGGPTDHFSGDDMEFKEMRIFGDTPSGLEMHFHSLRPVTLNDYVGWQSGDLSPASNPYGPVVPQTWFRAVVWTGSDDLRWAVDQQPNMEFQISIYLRGSSAPIILFSRSLEPYAAFVDKNPGGVFLGSFSGNKSAERIMRWRDEGRPPRLQDIDRIEVKAVPGWDGSRPGQRVLRGTSLFSPDTWTLKGLWIGAAAALPERAPRPTGIFHGWNTLFFDSQINTPLSVGQSIQRPVNIGNRPLTFDRDAVRPIERPIGNLP